MKFRREYIRRITMPRPLVAWSAVFIVVVIGVGLFLCLVASSTNSRPQKAATDAEVKVNPPTDSIASTAEQLGYCGPQACAECHRDRVAEFKETRHYLANCLPDPAKMPAGFSTGRTRCLFPDQGLQFEMSTSDGDFLQSAIVRTGTRTQATSSKIGFCYGLGGGADEVYFTWRDDRLFELPVAWLSAGNTWGASPFDVHGQGSFSRETTVRCLECHNTFIDHVTGSRNEYRRDSQILGVTCEVCHGPGRDHVNFHRELPHVNEPYAIVRPALLERERQLDLCAQCHSNALKHRAPAFRYRPGLVLDDFYRTYTTKHPEEDHVANQTTYLRQSRCFQESDSLTCVTCHNPHQRRTSGNAGSAACGKCHVPDDCRERPRIPIGARDECAGCHMPEARKIQVFFRTEEDAYVTPVKRYEHRIGIYPEATNRILLNWYRGQVDDESKRKAAELSAKLGEHYRIQANQLRTVYRFQAAIDACRESLKFDPDEATQFELRELISIQTGIDDGLQDAMWHERERRYDLAIQTFERILSVKPDHAMAHAKLGMTYAVVKQNRLAVEHLTRAIECDPNDPYAPAMLGWLAYLDNRPEIALAYYEQAETVEPYSAKINHQMALALAKLDRTGEAIDRCRRSLEINPRDVSVLVELVQFLRRSGEAPDALKYALKAAEITQFREPEIDLILSELYASVGQMHAAAITARKALEAARTRQASLVPRIQKRLREFESRPASEEDSQ